MFHPFRQSYGLLLSLDAAWTQRRERRAAQKAARVILLPDGSTHLRPAPPYNAALAAARLEGRWGPLPRPVNEQYLNSFAALRRLLDRLNRTLLLLISALASFALFTVGLTYWHSLLRRWGLVGPFSGRNVFGYALALLLCAGLGLLVVFFDGGKIWQLFVQFQRDSYGTAAWATLRELAAKGLVWEWDPATLVPFGAPERTSGKRWRFYRFLERRLLRRSVSKLPRHPLLLGHVPLAPLGRTQWFCLPLEQFARHCLVYGPPGSGKSASFLLLQARAFARLGSAIILDLKGELWQYTARYYQRSYRLDLMCAATSDRLLLGRLCQGDDAYAFELASLIIGYDPNKSGTENPFWPQSATMLLTCLFLHLAEADPDFTPADIFHFLAAKQFCEEATDPAQRDPLAFALMNSTPQVQARYAPFALLDGKTKSNIVVTMAASLAQFLDPVTISLFTPPTPAERARGCRIIDPVLLRKPGTGLYVIVAEGRAAQLANVLATCFGTLTNVLRRTGDPQDFAVYLRRHARFYLAPELAAQVEAQLAAAEAAAAVSLSNTEREQMRVEGYVAAYLKEHDLTAAVANPGYCLLQLDEAGNVALRGLSEDIGVGRGRRMPYFLGYQNLEQPAKQYGHDYAKALTQSVGTKLFLPAVSSTTADFAVNLLGKTTAYSYSSDDAKDDRLDTQRRQETARDLMTMDEMRTLPPYSQAIMVSLETAPVRLGFPPNAKEQDSRQDYPTLYQTETRSEDPALVNLRQFWDGQIQTLDPTAPAVTNPAPATAAAYRALLDNSYAQVAQILQEEEAGHGG